MQYVGNRARSLADKAAAFGAAGRGFKSHRARNKLQIGACIGYNKCFENLCKLLFAKNGSSNLFIAFWSSVSTVVSNFL